MMEHLEDVDAREVTRMVERDPVIVARLLKTVNSAYYGLQRTVTSPERAVVLLGPVTVVGLVAGMSMLRLRPLVTQATAGVAGAVLRHSLATAYLTRFLVEEVPEHRAPRAFPALVRNGTAFTAGLLHDFGKLILVYNFPGEAAALYGDRALDGLVAADDGCEHERLVFGCNHTEAGVVAALASTFPELLTDVVRLHHTPEALQGVGVAPATACLLRATVAASHAAELLGYGVRTGAARRGDLPPVWAEVLRQDAPTAGCAEALVARLCGEGKAVQACVSVLAQPDPEAVRQARPRLRLIG